MDEYRKFILQFRCKPGEVYSHTSIDEPKGSFKINSASDIDKFYEIYNSAMIQGVHLHMTEKPIEPSPLRVDLDFRFPIENREDSNILLRKYTKEDIDKIVNYYYKIVLSFIDVKASREKLKSNSIKEESLLFAYVMEKSKPIEYRGKLKDGIHIVFPYIVLSHTMQNLIRNKIIENGNDIFSGIPVINPHDDIIDKAIIDKNNWQMYGSRKPDCESYRVTYKYNYNFEENKGIVVSSRASASEELTYPKLFSMRDKVNLGSIIYEEKQSELDEYVRLILPSIDERRKSKIHKQIFGKCDNKSRNLASDDDYNFARQIVVECLNNKRAENYEEWIKLGWTLRNIDYRLLDTWIEFSRLGSKYVEGECQNMWNKMKSDTLGIGTLRWWARNDNPKQYDTILRTNVEILIDKSIVSDGAHYDLATVVHAIYKDKYRFTTRDTWYMYMDNRHKWVRTREGLKLRLLLSNDICARYLRRATYWTDKTRGILEEKEREKYEANSKKLMQISIRLKTAGYKDSVMKECKALFTDENFEETLDSHPHLIGFENGVYDLRMSEFREGLPDDYISFTTGRNYIDYDPESIDAKEIDAYFSQVFTNPSIKKYMKDLLTCIIDGGIRQEKFYIFTGGGSNSKSAILNLIQKAIGDYYCILPMSLLTQKRAAANAAQSELERTKGRRLAVMQEPGNEEKINIGLMKELSGGDRIMARGLFKEPIEFRPQFKMVMTCNELPEVPSDDGGTWRRIRVVEYTSKFVDAPNPENPKEFPLDPELLDKFDKWADTVISMLIHNHRSLDLKNIPEPYEVRMATEDYKKNNDIIGQYVTDRLEKDPNAKKRMQLNSIFTNFKSWAVEVVPKGKKVPDRTQLKIYLEKIFGIYATSGWKGMKYKTAVEEVDSDVE